MWHFIGRCRPIAINITFDSILLNCSHSIGMSWLSIFSKYIIYLIHLCTAYERTIACFGINVLWSMSDEQHALSIHHQFPSIDKFQWSSSYNDLHHSKFHNSSTLNLFFMNWHHAIVCRINWFALKKARHCIITNNTFIPLIRNCYTHNNRCIA